MFKTDKAPQVSIDKEMHKLLKKYAKEKGMVLHAATKHFLTLGMQQENLIQQEAAHAESTR
jgi:hypothetical protein